MHRIGTKLRFKMIWYFSFYSILDTSRITYILATHYDKVHTPVTPTLTKTSLNTNLTVTF